MFVGERVCKLCYHAERELIEDFLSWGRTDAEIATLYGFDPEEVDQHRSHCAPSGRDAAPPARRAHLEAVHSLKWSSLGLLKHSQQDPKQARVALSAMAFLYRLLHAELKLAQQARASAHTSIRDLKEWQQLKARLIGVLVEYPDALRALREALGDAS